MILNMVPSYNGPKEERAVRYKGKVVIGINVMLLVVLIQHLRVNQKIIQEIL